MVNLIIRHGDKPSQISAAEQTQPYLEWHEDSGLWLRKPGKPPMSMRVDFVTGRQGWRAARSGQQREALARACGLKAEQPLHIIDATAGLGRDAFMLATLGASMTLIERHAIVRELLIDGLRRAREAGHAETVSRMQLIGADAVDWLSEHAKGEAADVVYLDPMYQQTRRAAAGKELTLLQALLGDQDDGDVLLPAALSAAGNRVVVKRHRQARPLADMTPSYQLTGRSTRFDIYRVD